MIRHEKKAFIILFIILISSPLLFFSAKIIVSTTHDGIDGIKNFRQTASDSLTKIDPLLKINSRFKITFLKTSPSRKVILGKNGWLFFIPENTARSDKNPFRNNENVIDDFRGTAPFSDEQLNKIHSYISGKASMLGRKNIKFIVIIPPNKETVYPEFLPDTIKKVYPETRLDQFLKKCSDIPDVTFIDLRKPLLEAKKERQIYIKSDTHWNFYGAFIGYSELMKTVKKEYPATPVFTMDDFLIKNISFTQSQLPGIGDLSRFINSNSSFEHYIDKFTVKDESKSTTIQNLPDKNLFNPYHNFNTRLIRYSDKKSTKPSLLLFHDSFELYIGFMCHNFQEYSKIWNYNISEEIVDYCKPDIVVLEILERYLYLLAEI